MTTLIVILGVVILFIVGYIWWNIRRPLPYPPAQSLLRPLPDEHQRHITVDGVVNFRDIGGYQTIDGRTVAWGKVYRSGRLSYITPTGKTDLLALQPQVICDLRSEEEIQNDPHPHLPDTRYLDMNVAAEVNSLGHLWRLFFRPRKVAGVLPNLYTDLVLEKNAPALSRAMHLLIDPANLPIIIHCTAGKDRTGVVVALTLALLGVDRQTIIADYTQSNHHFLHYDRMAAQMLKRLKWLRLTTHNLFPLLVADPATMQTLFNYIDTTYGSVEAYATLRLGFDADKVAQLQALLLA